MGSSPGLDTASCYFNGDVAHQVEQRIENPRVVGSSPTVATIYAPVVQFGRHASLRD